MIDLRDAGLPAESVIRALDLRPHPEGGHYREVWRDAPPQGRGSGTSILFLLKAEETSHWHRVDAAETWLWQAGGPLVLSISPDGHDAEATWLGPDLAARQVLQRTVPKDAWQSAASLGHWTLVSCLVCPAFSFEGFQLAAPDWRPTPRS